MVRDAVRAKAARILEPIISAAPMRSDDEPKDHNLYRRYTGGLTQTRLEDNWDTIDPKTKKKGQMTGCNAFVGWYSSQIGTTHFNGFHIERDLRKVGMERAWVKSAPGKQPGYGDICLHASQLHVSVSLDIVGGAWSRLNAGQGGPRVRSDILKVTSDVWHHSVLKGWVDIGIYLGRAPDWLVGWWRVSFRGDTLYYYFDLNYQVRWSAFRPRDTLTRMTATDGGVGSFTVTNRGHVAVKWKSGNKENFTRNLMTSDERMDGSWNESMPISAMKME